jgi:hypothetical protein
VYYNKQTEELYVFKQRVFFYNLLHKDMYLKYLYWRDYYYLFDPDAYVAST